MNTHDNSKLLVMVLVSMTGLLMTTKMKVDLFDTQEKKLAAGFKFLGLYAMYETVFGKNVNGLIDKPKKLDEFLKLDWVKFLSLFLISLGITQEIEQSFFATITFVLFIHLLRDEEEKKKHPYLI
jgi:hypothetical protein